jgi:hypothetical protein
MRRNYTRRRSEYVYDITVYEATPPATAGRFCASVVNMVRLRAGQTVAVHADLQDAYAATRDKAVTQLEAAIEKWVKDQTPST